MTLKQFIRSTFFDCNRMRASVMIEIRSLAGQLGSDAILCVGPPERLNRSGPTAQLRWAL